MGVLHPQVGQSTGIAKDFSGQHPNKRTFRKTWLRPASLLRFICPKSCYVRYRCGAVTHSADLWACTEAAGKSRPRASGDLSCLLLWSSKEVGRHTTERDVSRKGSLGEAGRTRVSLAKIPSIDPTPMGKNAPAVQPKRVCSKQVDSQVTPFTEDDALTSETAENLAQTSPKLRAG